MVSGRRLAKALARLGWDYDHHQGSHMIPRQGAPPHRRLTSPDHDPIQTGTLAAIMRAPGIDRDQLRRLLD
ncbi:MAG: type II toxin-antitoxin system HicA family toxin [Desulfarculus sp.]|nr:type II toxin-antitoxin system HicA family toxin [Desulfarculus sp.]